ncbi:phage major capsid protein [Lysinibacillus fusiformis]|uniref:phage major capsid protein n=1 Tax=Lysinibacillus fusiformis TaxID=28031 RepID=UPI003D06D689
MPDLTIEELGTEVRQRLDAVDKQVSDRLSDDKLTDQIRGIFEDLTKDEEFVRKIRFGQGAAERQLVGTKYARYGLSVSDVEWLYDAMTAQRGMPRKGGGVHQGPSDELVRTFEAISAARYMSDVQVREIDQKAIDGLFPRIPLAEFHGNDRELARQGKWELTGAYQRAIRAMDTQTSGEGQQLIGAQYVHDLWEAPRKLGRVFNLIDTFEMTDPTAYLPVEVDIPEMLFVAENTASNSAEYTTVETGSQRVQVDAKKFVIHQMWSGEMEEDSIIPFVPFLRRQAALSIAHYSDSLALNGDNTNAATGNINLDDADPADTKHYLAFDGIRHAALVDNTGNAVDVAGAITLAQLNNLRGLMVDYTRLVDWGHPTDPDDLVYLSDPATADKIAMLDEYLTVDKYGPQATVFNGEAGRISGHRHISTIAMSKTEADGKVSTTGANNIKGQVAAFNRRGFKAGWRRRVMFETERLPARDQTRFVYSLRLGFGRFTPTGAASGIEAAAVAYDISL